MKKFFMVCCLVLLCSCSHISMPTSVYIIDVPNEYAEQYRNRLQTGSGPVFAIMHINIPSYLNRPQIVMRDKGAKIIIEERHRWGENLDKAISRVLSDALTNNLTAINGVAVPLKLGMHPDYTIQVDISHFEGNINDYLELDAFWTLQKGGMKILQASFYKKLSVEHNYSGFVQAYGELLYLLAQAMSDAIYAHIR